MKKFRIEDMSRGWFIGDFEPAAFKTKNFEVGKDITKKGKCGINTIINLQQKLH